jgi:hypothetical protein
MRVDFGKVLKGTKVVRSVVLRNGGSRPVAVQAATANCQCFHVHPFQRMLQPGDEREIKITFDSWLIAPEEMRGKKLKVASNDTGYAVAWHEIREDGPHIRASIYDNGAFQSQAAAELTDSLDTLEHVCMVGNALGYAVGFLQDDGAARSLYVSRGDGTPEGWPTTAELVESDDEDGIDDGPALAAAGNGYAVAFVIYDGSAANDAMVNIFAQDAWQNTPESIDTAALDVRAVELQSNGTGYCSTFKVRDGDNSGAIYANIWSGGSWMDDPWLIQTGTNLRYYENDRVVIVPDGRLYDLAWIQNDPLDALDPHLRTVWVLRGL